ncbi:hypothetical protein D3C80_2027350 [compost metagenome]
MFVIDERVVIGEKHTVSPRPAHIAMAIVGNITILSQMLIEHELHVELAHSGHYIREAGPDLLVQFD